MCGIAGAIYTDHGRIMDESIVTRMRDVMQHRGPDDAGTYTSGPVALAHRRLSIVGLSTGHQPMATEDNALCIVFNGEIYNYPKLKNELQSLGYRFRTESDTEVILHMYSHYGKECVNYLNGMFAFVIWDRENQHLFMARDRLGVKPFYYAETGDSIVFASEIKSILEYPEFRAKCNKDAVYEYLVFRAVSGEETLFEGVKSLLPGHYMTVSRNGIEIEKYWDPRQKPMDYNISVPDARNKLSELLQDAVRIRLMSEVPLGTFCSGGIDSSLVTAIASKQIGEPVNTFSVGFHEAEFDESYYARMVSAQYQTNHHELKLNAHEFTGLLPDLIHLNDEPLNFSNSVHIYALSKLAKEYVTVVLTGEGADELFMGYPRYQIPRIADNIKRMSVLARPLLNMLSKVKDDHRLEKLSYYLKSDLNDIMLLNSATSRVESVSRIIQKGIPTNLLYRTRILDDSKNMDALLSRMSIQDQQTYLVSILNRQDKMSMGASVEARVPFLDYRVAEFANSLPAKTRIRGFNSKMLIKMVAGDFLPKEVIYRRKSGFGVPLANWFRDNNALGNIMNDEINQGDYSEYLNKDSLMKMFKEHKANQADNSEILWTALNFLMWKRIYNL